MPPTHARFIARAVDRITAGEDDQDTQMECLPLHTAIPHHPHLSLYLLIGAKRLIQFLSSPVLTSNSFSFTAVVHSEVQYHQLFVTHPVFVEHASPLQHTKIMQERVMNSRETRWRQYGSSSYLRDNNNQPTLKINLQRNVFHESQSIFNNQLPFVFTLLPGVSIDIGPLLHFVRPVRLAVDHE